ncbi:MAG TPA: alpha/beta fold hydrolase, partial [Gemmatimonadaceae bacterium]|nr:alpha/beta fold hydrolase [Gemmatimonadaceae bacterium]
MTVHAGFAPARGANLCYQVAGSGPPVVLLHGFSFDRRIWDDQMDALTPHYTVVRYDLRGFGKSPPGSTAYTHADDLTAVMDHLGIERAALVGLSLGGGAAINFAITRPERVSALVAVAPSLGGIKWSDEFVAAHAAIRSAAQGQGIHAARELWLGRPIFAPALANPL